MRVSTSRQRSFRTEDTRLLIEPAPSSQSINCQHVGNVSSGSGAAVPAESPDRPVFYRQRAKSLRRRELALRANRRHRAGHKVVKIPLCTPSDRLANHVLCMHGRWLGPRAASGTRRNPAGMGSEDAIGGQSSIPTTGNISRVLWAPASPHPLARRCARLEQLGRVS